VCCKICGLKVCCTSIGFKTYNIICRLEVEEQSRQKLQLEKVAIETKMRKQDEAIAQYEAVNTKVYLCSVDLFVLYFL